VTAGEQLYASRGVAAGEQINPRGVTAGEQDPRGVTAGEQLYASRGVAAGEQIGPSWGVGTGEHHDRAVRGDAPVEDCEGGAVWRGWRVWRLERGGGSNG